uniref:DUF4939 domain-containing protein n=1 Tax=Fundulus heteroclitus TaxID=8078 RepID=A0A3Q2P8C5_FUNHE
TLMKLHSSIHITAVRPEQVCIKIHCMPPHLRWVYCHFQEAPSSVPGVGVSIPVPEPFSGDLSKSRGFLLQCSLVFSRTPQSFPDDAHKISDIVGLLRDRALKWADSFIDETTIHNYSYAEFLTLFKRTFSSSLIEEEAGKRLWEQDMELGKGFENT